MPATSYIGKCRECSHSTRVDWAHVQDLDSHRWAKSARTGERVLVTPDGAAYDQARPFILNGVAVSARCPDHGVYRLQLLRGRVVATITCDARCTTARGPKCDCSCGGANHGADHAAR
jgi:hypothetical protein